MAGSTVRPHLATRETRRERGRATVVVALVVAVGSILIALTTAVVVPLLNAKVVREAKQDDWNRQDAIAASVNKKLDESIKQGKATHALSNQAYTEGLENDSETTEMLLAALAELAAFRQAAGQKPLASTTSRIRQAKAKLVKLEQQIAERRAIAEQVVAAVNGV